MSDFWCLCRFLGAPGWFRDWYWPAGAHGSAWHLLHGRVR